ncbi:MAG: hypothetical protein AAB403_01140 [Planctomycetota bacterium]
MPDSTRYVHDGGEPVESNDDHVIAEYGGNNNLLGKYIYAPGVDQPVCMIETGCVFGAEMLPY